MPLWPIMLWPKPKSRQQQQRHVKQYTGNGYINLQFAIRTFAAAPSKQYWLHVFVINVLLFSVSIVEAQHRQPQQQQHQQQSGVSNNYEGVDVVSALTGLSNGYATPSYMKNYYQHVSEAVAVEQQNQHQQQQQQQHNADHGLRYEENIAATAAAAGIIGREFLSLQTNNYANTINTKGNTVAPGVRTTLQQEAGFNIYDGGFVPTTFTNAGSHYAATLHGLQTNNAQQQQSKTNSATANNNNNLQGNQELYENINDQNNYNFNIIPTTTDNNGILQQSSSFRRLLNYANNAGQENIATAATTLGDDTTGHGNAANEERSNVGTNVGVGRGGLANYRLVYADDDQQSFMLQNFYNQQQQQQEEQQQQTAYNEPALEQKQNFANYFPQSATTATTTASAGYEIENPQKYYTLNNYQQQTATKPQYQQEQHQQPQYQQQQQTYLQYQLRPYDIQQKSQQQIDNNGIQPATYFQSFIRHKNDDVADSNNREQHHYEHRHITRDNNQNWKQNQIMANYQQKQINIEKQQEQQQQQQPYPHHLQQQQQQTHVNNHYQRQLIQEPETAETTHHSTRVKKAPKHKNKRHDNQEHNFSYDTYEQNHIETETQDHSILQLEQLQQLQHQLHQQQQQFVDLQHQLIDHDQQLQIQKQLAQHPPPSLPPITHTVHHNSHSLQALAGTPLSKHTQIIKTIPIPQRQQIHIPYRENVTIEIPNPVITTVSKPLAIEIPVTKTVTIPQVQEVKIPIEKLKPVPVERPIPYIVEKRVPYTVEKQVAKPVYYPVPIKVPIVHTVIHKVHSPHYTQHSHEPVHPAPSPHHHIHHHQQHPSIRLPHNVYRTTGHKRGHGHSPAHHYLK